MQISEIMTHNVAIASPDDIIIDVARRMADKDIGFIPIGENDRLIGMVTDRDIVTRGVATGLDGRSKVREVMSNDVKYCRDTDQVEDVLANMGDIQVRRLVVIDDNKRLCGIVTLADAARDAIDGTRSSLKGVVQPGGDHNQSGA
ncbi:MAG: CBS domain-containing protein [Martelella sp.]|uniref:CBS domain-containing protein n=1 Tax=Martelella sp. TaxID=1969699 RepID=UPI003242BB42